MESVKRVWLLSVTVVIGEGTFMQAEGKYFFVSS
jgi:hypothetical protein